MNTKLLDLSGKIDAFTISIYRTIFTASDALDIGFFIVGATARDIILHHGYGIESRRLTYDIDLGIRIEDWHDFEKLQAWLIETGDFLKHPKKAERFTYLPGDIPVDIVPFGTVAQLNNSITWPPDHNITMSIVGFDDAYKSAQIIRLDSDPILDVRVATPPALVALKLVAWDEKYPERTKDARDLAFLLRNYLDVGNLDRLYGEYEHLLTDDFDYDLTGAVLLGMDMSDILSPQAKSYLAELLKSETGDNSHFRLANNMSTNEYSESFDDNLNLLNSLKYGLTQS